ncbi:MAG: hypothetical protein HOD11_13180 [Candidatus Marinimicrobia bacterium]|jgi:hypothetical protein|nr:hypothetical protein [Candidatus Neomarinimicrobiota bacterium]MBT4419746.1 hypothetical protein [Candidatus Neomarinimicrobiota bacterium]
MNTINFDWSLIHELSKIITSANIKFMGSLLHTTDYYQTSLAVLMRMKKSVENLLQQSLSDAARRKLQQSQIPETILNVYCKKQLWPEYQEIVNALGYSESLLEPFIEYAEELLMEYNNKDLDEAIDADNIEAMLDLIPKTCGRSFQTAVDSLILSGDNRLLPILLQIHKTRGPLWEFPFLQNTIDKLLRSIGS